MASPESAWVFATAPKSLTLNTRGSAADATDPNARAANAAAMSTVIEHPCIVPSSPRSGSGDRTIHEPPASLP